MHITPQYIKTFDELNEYWLSASEIAKRSGVDPRTTRAHLKKMVATGLVVVNKSTSKFLYNLPFNKTDEYKARLKELEEAREIYRGKE